MSTNRIFAALSRQAVVRTSVLQSHHPQSLFSPTSAGQKTAIRRFSDAIPHMKPVSKEERLAFRAARKERAARVLQQAKGGEGGSVAPVSSSSSGTRSFASSKYMWYASVGVPSALLVWGFSDSNSPPAKFCRMIGLTGFIESYTNEIAKPSHDKLLPDWSQV
jgi:hypothetical protein